MPNNIVLCFDGTWNRPDQPGAKATQETNVRRFHKSIAAQDSAGNDQLTWYDEGVGTKWYERVRGGMFGYGIDENIIQGYRYLIQNYRNGDRVFVFGFSRGAYTARSLIGLIRNCGLLLRQYEALADQAYAIYRDRGKAPSDLEAQTFRSTYAREIDVEFLGVWDTVGALGIPLGAFQSLNMEEYAFHDTALSGIVKNAFHAIAIDERRQDYQATLWTNPLTPAIEQRWFAGAHCDVGGGYPELDLSLIPLEWMQRKALAAGLQLTPVAVPKDAHQAPLHDSYGDFLRGLYKLTHRPWQRSMQVSSGQQTIDPSVHLRYGALADYRPGNPGFPGALGTGVIAASGGAVTAVP